MHTATPAQLFLRQHLQVVPLFSYWVCRRHDQVLSGITGNWADWVHWSWLAVSAPGKTNNNFKKVPALRIASWNVRTMCPGLSEDLTRIEDARKIATIGRELSRLNVDIASLQETRIAANGSLREKDKENNPMNPVCM